MAIDAIVTIDYIEAIVTIEAIEAIEDYLHSDWQKWWCASHSWTEPSATMIWRFAIPEITLISWLTKMMVAFCASDCIMA